MPRDLTDVMDRFWTIEQAVEHLGYSRRTVERYIHDGLRVYFPHAGGYLDRDELLEVVRRKQINQKQTRGKVGGA